MDIGLFIIRLVLGLVVAAHGGQKLFGWFGGYGLKGTSGYLASRGFHPSVFWTVAGGASEFGGGLLLAAGLLNPLGPIAVAAVMLTAITAFHWPKVWNTQGGLEYPLVNLAAAVGVGLAGPGAYSLDGAFGTSLPPAAALVIAVLATLGYFAGSITSARKTSAGRKPAQKAAA